MPFGLFVGFILVLPALGVSLVKPSVVGTTARASKDKVRSLGYSIYYTMVNIGGLLGPYAGSLALRYLGAGKIFQIAAAVVFAMFFFVFLFFRDPKRTAEAPDSFRERDAPKFRHRASESQVHGISADFHRLLDRLLATVDRNAGLSPSVCEQG